VTAQRPEASLYRRNAAHVTSRRVLHRFDKEAEVLALPRLSRRRSRVDLERGWAADETAAARDAGRALAQLASATESLKERLVGLTSLDVPELRGKAESELQRVERVRVQLEGAVAALEQRDFGGAGAATAEATRELWLVGGPLIVALNKALSQAAIPRDQRMLLTQNFAAREVAKRHLESLRANSAPAEELLQATATVHSLAAEGLQLAATVLRTGARTSGALRRGPHDVAGRLVPTHELETFADVGGLDEVKESLRSTIGAILDRPDDAARYRVVHNGILFHGPPGTGKTLLSRALAGEYGLRYLRFSPASIASAYVHEAASNLQRLFDTARENTPCLLFLDEVDTIASARDDHPSADHREVVTQLMNCLEEYRATPGLVIAAATNSIDRLDPGLREGRFDAKILVPLPDPAGRKQIVRVHLERRRDAVDWSEIDLDEIAAVTQGRNAAALEGFVTAAAQAALAEQRAIEQRDVMAAVRAREGGERVVLENPVAWDDVVLPDDVRESLLEVLNVFVRPDLARTLGVTAPAGLLLWGPPGTGKTTIAKAMATEVAASFYEHSSADLLSKWAGESEEKVAKLFARAKANRPAIVFIDEIDGLLRKRGGDAASPWEERVVGQFLRELDGLDHQEGVLLVGATNRIDIIDPAIQGRRLTTVEVGLPDGAGRLRLLRVLCRDSNLAEDVDLASLARSTEGMSGADLKRLRDAAGMKALTRAARGDGVASTAAIEMSDFDAALVTLRASSSLAQV
jgi:transitional endoplasmic reticulum ATPase